MSEERINSQQAPQAEMTEEQAARELSEQCLIRREKLAALQAEGRDPFLQTRFDRTSNATQIKANFEELEGSTQRIAGRLMSKRGMGKASFCDLQDQDGRIQIYVQVDDLGKEEFTYTIVGITEADPFEDKISNESPVGKALLGRKKGETVEIQTENGVLNYKILEIIKG